MSVLPIYLFGSEILRTKARAVREPDEATVKLIHDMFETMHKANGIGLAATQVGDLRRVIVVDVTEAEDEPAEGEVPAEPRVRVPQAFAFINPEVIASSGSLMMEEGCLSIPEVRAEVERAETIRVRYLDENFMSRELEASGILARVILHEIDHLDGVLFIDRISSPKRALLKAQLRSIRKGDVEVSYPVMQNVEV